MLAPFEKPKFCNNRALEISRDLAKIFTKRRTIRQFSPEKPDREIIENAIDVARLAPSGANRQPWSFALIEGMDLKQEIRKLSEKEEYLFYVEKPNKKWIKDLEHLHPNKEKEFLTEAPYLIVIFYSHFDIDELGEKCTNYYAKESVGIATGMLISALHLAGLSVLTYTPKRMQFLSRLLGKEVNERPFMLLGVGHPTETAEVPVITKKALEDILTTYS